MSAPELRTGSLDTKGSLPGPLKSHSIVNLERQQVETTALTSTVAQELFEDMRHRPQIDQHQWGDVIVLVGSSTAGKSSIIAEMLKQRPEFYEEGGDLASVRIPLGFLEKNHPEDLAFLQSVIKPDQKVADSPRSAIILDYVLGEEPIFNNHVSAQDKERYFIVRDKLKASLTTALPPGKFHVINDLMMDGILDQAKGGRPVIFDVLRIEEVYAHALGKHTSLKVALVYCPFGDLAERVVKRNKEAMEKDPNEVRPGAFPLEQFCELFGSKKESDQSEVIQRLTKHEAEEAIDIAYKDGEKYYREHEPKHLEKYVKENADTKAKILEKLGFKPNDAADKVTELTPRFKGYHVVINTAPLGKSKDTAVRESVSALLFRPEASPDLTS